MNRVPFEPMLLPIKKEYIKSDKFLSELSVASEKIGRLNA